VAAIALVAMAVHGPEIDTRAGLRRMLAGGLAATAAISGAFVAFPATTAARPSLGGLSVVQVGLAVAAVALAPPAWRRGRASARPLLSWSAVALVAVAAGIAADAPALFVLGALAVLIGETREVVTAYRAEAALRFEAELESAVAESRARAARAEHEERLHDSRSAVLAVQAATRMLEHDVEAMDPIERRRLSAAIDTELVRVRELLGGDPENAPSTCDVRQVLQPLVTCHAAAGRSLAFHVPAGIEARCRASAVSEIVQNLLDNAAVHAPGARIRLHARATGGAVEVRVSDDGPGIDPTRRESVFERGTTTGGSGLGLFVSRRLAHELGGDLWVEEAARDGAEFVLRLPGGTASAHDTGRAESVEDAAQGRDVGDLDDHRGVLVRPGNPDLEHRVGA
jgi:signal transduction histidine kinase